MRPSNFSLPRETEIYRDGFGYPKTEVVSDELLQSTVNVRTVNGHVDIERLDTSIVQHIQNRTDTAMCQDDYNNTASIPTSTATVVKFIARENVAKARSMGFFQGPSTSCTNMGTEYSNSSGAGGPNTPLASNMTFKLHYHPLSSNAMRKEDLFRGRFWFTGSVLLFLTLTSLILWGQSLAKLKDLQRLFLSTLRESSQSTVDLYTGLTDHLERPSVRVFCALLAPWADLMLTIRSSPTIPLLLLSAGTIMFCRASPSMRGSEWSSIMYSEDLRL